MAKIQLKTLSNGIIVKKCGRCQKWKELYEFNKNQHNFSGYVNWCRICEHEKIKEYKIKYPEKFILRNIKARCNNPKHHHAKWYHDKGIKCLITAEEILKLMIRDGYWKMDDPTIDRIDNAGNYTFKNCRFIERPLNSKKDKFKPILLYDLKGNFIREFKSVKEAAIFTNQTSENISFCLIGKYKQASNSIWRYK